MKDNPDSSSFIVIEGIDGAGTTTQAKRLVERLKKNGQRAVYTFEPTDGPIGGLIRQILNRRMVKPLDGDRFEVIDADTLTLLFSADRLDHRHHLIEPSLKKGLWVVSDRYYYSTIAYQGVKGDIDWITRVNKKARRPDMVFYLRMPPEEALKRIGGRSGRSIFEKLDFLREVRDLYDSIFEKDRRTFIVDGLQAVEAVEAEIWKIVARTVRK